MIPHRDRGVTPDLDHPRMTANVMTLASKQLRLQVCDGVKPLARDEALKAGYSPEECNAYFGAA